MRGEREIGNMRQRPRARAMQIEGASDIERGGGHAWGPGRAEGHGQCEQKLECVQGDDATASTQTYVNTFFAFAATFFRWNDRPNMLVPICRVP